LLRSPAQPHFAPAVLCAAVLAVACEGRITPPPAAQRVVETHPGVAEQDPATSLQRFSGEELRIRLGRLFPIYNSYEKGFLPWYLGSRISSIEGKYLTQRSTSALSQNYLRSWAVGWCGNLWSQGTYDEKKLLLSGEKMPPATEAALRTALVLSRNIWLYPYPVESEQVRILADVYRKAVSDGANDAEARRAVCSTALLAPNFWFGNPEDADVIRRLALVIGHRVPTFEEYDAYLTGALSLEGYVDQLMAEPGYLESVKFWHRLWFALPAIPPEEAILDGRLLDGRFGPNWGATALSDAVIGEPKKLLQADGTMLEVTALMPYRQNTWLKSYSESCEDKVQAFDATTQRVIWEQQVNGTWVEMAPDAVKESKRDPVTHEFVYCESDFQSLTCRGTPVGTRRVRRITNSGEVQNGYSPVKLWWSGDTVYVCNALLRHFTTCAYRPPKGKPMLGYHHYGGSVADATITFGVDFGGNSGYLIDSLGNKDVLDAFSCGQFNPDAPTEEAAFPKTAPYNEVVISGTTGVGPYPHGGATVKELGATAVLSVDLFSETEALVSAVVKENQDYRQILTADWTMARGPLELFYRTRGRVFPAYPPQARRPSDPDYLTLKKIYPARFEVISKKWFQNSQGNFASAFYFEGGKPEGSPDAYFAGELRAKPVSGVLTQNAFLSSAGSTKIRSVAAKIFRTFTCGELSAWVPNNPDLHESFVYTNDTDGRLHLDKAKGCYSCHVTLDPISSVLSSSFSQVGDVATGGKGEFVPWGGIFSGYGIAGQVTPSKGALFDQPIEGIGQLGKVLADSPQFARCTVQRTFEGIFGRLATQADTALLRTATEHFTQGYSYNALVRELALSPNYLQAP
jgi:hypothetical protein